MDRFVTRQPKSNVVDDIVDAWQRRPRIKHLCTKVHRCLIMTLPTGGKRPRPWLGWGAEKKRRVGQRLVELKNYVMLRNEMGRDCPPST